MLDLRTYGGVGAGHVIDAVDQRFEIQHRAAHQEWQLATCGDSADESRGVCHELCGAVGVQGVTDIDEVMRRLGEFQRRRLGRADVHVPVHQGRIDTDDLNRPARRDGQSRSRFARGRWACNGQKRKRGQRWRRG